jgi:hypothetical protein
MAARVSITGVSIGNGESHRWRGVTSPLPVRPNETHVRIHFGISHVPGNHDTAVETVIKALETLQQQGDIKSCYVGILGSTPEVICNPGAEVVRAIHESRTVDNDFVIGLQDKLRELLDKIGAQK